MALVHQTVIAECERCAQRSGPILPEQVEAWQATHDQRIHEPADLEELMAKHGHVAEGVVEWMDQDDSSGHARCSCGYRSRSAKVCWIDDYIERHLREEMAKLGLKLYPTTPTAPVTDSPAAKPQHRSRVSPLAERSAERLAPVPPA